MGRVGCISPRILGHPWMQGLLSPLSDGWRSHWHSLGLVLVLSQTFPKCGLKPAQVKNALLMFWRVWGDVLESPGWQTQQLHPPGTSLPSGVLRLCGLSFPILVPPNGLRCSRAGTQHGGCRCGDGWVNIAVEARGPKSWLPALRGRECHRRQVHPCLMETERQDPEDPQLPCPHSAAGCCCQPSP